MLLWTLWSNLLISSHFKIKYILYITDKTNNDNAHIFPLLLYFLFARVSKDQHSGHYVPAKTVFDVISFFINLLSLILSQLVPRQSLMSWHSVNLKQSPFFVVWPHLHFWYVHLHGQSIPSHQTAENRFLNSTPRNVQWLSCSNIP